jgi:diketogulonate reductase-like aldo/keto reductase
VPTIRLPSGDQILVLGEGTWHLAEDPARRRPEIAALRCGPGIGMNLIDAAEMYANGDAVWHGTRETKRPLSVLTPADLRS